MIRTSEPKRGNPVFRSALGIALALGVVAGGTVVSTPAIEHLGLRLRTGRHAVIARARHEMFMENDAIRGQVFAAFDAFVTEQSS